MTADQERVFQLGLAVFVLAAALVPLVRRFALDRGITDRPAPGKVHTVPTPYLGGLAIVAAAVAVTGWAPGWDGEALVLVVAALVVGAVGLVDDLRTVHPRTRVAVEVLAATAAFSVGYRVRLVNDPVDLVLTVGWVVVVTNAFNLFDNMDGAVAAVGAVIAGAVAVLAALEGQWFEATLAAAVAGVCAGYLGHNWHPATIFMGDAGALFVGFLVAALALRLDTGVAAVPREVAILLLVALPLFDTTLVVISRLRAHRSIYIGGTDHMSHRLLRLGLSQPAVCVTLAAVTVLTTGLGVAVARGAVEAWAAAATVGLAAIVGLVLLLRAPVYDPGAAREPAPAHIRAETA